MVAAAVLGGGYGIYLAVDAALITQVLPAAAGPGEGPRHHQHRQLRARRCSRPALAAPIVAYLGGYPVLYGLTAVVTLLGGVFVYRIRSVR